MRNLIDYLGFRAKLEPHSVAIQGTRRQIEFGQLFRLVKQVSNKLRQRGIKPGHIVVTSIPDKYLDWIVTLALLHEATITCSYQDSAPLPSWLGSDWLITVGPDDHLLRDKTIRIDNTWLADAQKYPHDIDHLDYQSAESLVRIILTSGTTGHPRAVALTTNLILSRVRNASHYDAYPTINLMSLTTAGGFSSAVSCTINGLPLYCANSRKDTIALINRFAVESLYGSPAHLSGVIADLSTGEKITSGVKLVRYTGGLASPRLLAGIETHLSKNIVGHYGSTEAWGICMFKPTSQTDPHAMGYPFVGTDIQIVNDADEPVEGDEEGLVRVRTPYMVHEYYKDVEASSKSFRGGWFYPGDRARRRRDGLLVYAGRDSELINRGGTKIDPEPMDEFLNKYPGVRDAAVFAFEGKRGIHDMAAAVVVGDDFETEELKKSLVARFGRTRCPSIVVRAKQIPRNQMGKAMRTRMSEQLARSLAKREGNLS